MKVTVKTEKELSEANLWPVGVYSFEILPGFSLGQKTLKTEETRSKKGNDMIVLAVQVFNESGGYQFIADYLTDEVAYKTRHAAVACGLLSSYEAGELNVNDFIGKCGKVKIRIQKGKEKENSPGEFYPDRNAISDYVVEVGDGGNAMPPPNHPAAASIPDDTIPFN